MRVISLVSIRLKALFLLGFVVIFNISHAQSSVNLRVMSANLNGDAQKYQPFAIRIFQGLKPDIVAIQEFNYSNNADADIRAMVDTAFGTNFYYYREPYTANGDIPNGIISRYLIVNAGSWADAQQSLPNRGFAWAQIQLPGTNFLYVVSVHLLTSTATARAAEATELQGYIQTNFPANAWIVLAGDFNTGSRTETCMGTFKTFLSDSPIPVDNVGNSDTSENRNNPHDYVLPSFAFTNLETATVLPSHSFPSGLVFDSAVYTPLSDVSPVQSADSGMAQHMAVMKDFLIPATGGITNAPAITGQPTGQTNAVGAVISFTVTANGGGTLNYQWQFNGTNISGATANPLALASAQLTNSGNYSVIITNLYGSITSSVATLLITNASPAITTQPQSQSIAVGQTATFSLAATGTSPLNYQWQFNGTNISGAITNPFSLINAQLTNTGNYSVIVSNFAGSATSSVAILTVSPPSTNAQAVLAGWDTSGLSKYGPSPFAPTTSAPNLTITGLTRGSGVTTLNTASTNSWGGNGFDAASESAAITANDYATFAIAANVGYTVSFNSLSQFGYKRSTTGATNGVLQFQVGSSAFTDIATFYYSSTANAWLPAVDLSGIAALQNVGSNTVVTFRLVNYKASGSAGNWYITDVSADASPDFAIQGSVNAVVSATNAPAVIGAPAFAGGQLQFSVGGTVGGNYIVQASTNLTGGNWISLLTNQAPFIFNDTNIVESQQFYRVVAP
ncbi:MAG TPA: immunoglobulin domain-containing protein [Verrucomicrobiae bacterium]|jgi:endonuclease/exonuclease/phosphatase family metal-dependent hydrolase